MTWRPERAARGATVRSDLTWDQFCGRTADAEGVCVARRLRSDHPIVGLVVPSTDAQWARIEPFLPDRTPKRGGRWRDHRQMIDAIAFKFRTGTQWMHLPEKYGNWRGVYRLRMWAADGTWVRMFHRVDGPKRASADEPADHALGRSRGGLTTKIHLAADGRCRPLAFLLTGGQANDAAVFTEVMARRRVPRRRVRPRTRPGCGPGGQDLFVARDPRAPAQPLYPRGHPDPGGPERPPLAVRQPGRVPSRFRP